MKKHIDNILKKVADAQNENLYYETVFSESKDIKAKNEFVFFLKPELTLPGSEIDLKQILEIIADKFDEYNFNAVDIKILSAKYMEKHNIIGQHYGVINALARDAMHNLSDDALTKFNEVYDDDYKSAHILGGLEFLEKHPDFSPVSLFYLWQNMENVKLAGGTYCVKLRIDKEPTYVINGFHPNQLEHFTSTGRLIVVFTIRTNTSWEVARNDFTGATNPENAKEGSIRKTLLNKAMELGLGGINMSKNGVHLSAGAVEGLVELIRFNSNYENGEELKPADFQFGRQLQENFKPETVKTILVNTDIEVNGKAISVFDYTEEKDSDEAIQLLKLHF